MPRKANKIKCKYVTYKKDGITERYELDDKGNLTLVEKVRDASTEPIPIDANLFADTINVEDDFNNIYEQDFDIYDDIQNFSGFNY